MGFYYKHPSLIEVEENTKDSLDKFVTIKVSTALNSAVVDRTGYLNNFCDIKDPVVAADGVARDFNELVNNRAAEIFALGKEVRFEWNGNTQSNVLFAALGNYITNNPKAKKPVLWVKNNALVRQAELYNTFKANFDLSPANSKFVYDKELTDEAVVVYEDLGDILTGPSHNNLGRAETPAVEDLPELYQIMYPIFSHIPSSWDTTELMALTEWVKYVMTTQWHSIRRHIKAPERWNNDQIIQFYDTEEFHQWYLNTPIASQLFDNGRCNKYPIGYITQFVATSDILGSQMHNKDIKGTNSNEIPSPIKQFGLFALSLDATYNVAWGGDVPTILEATDEF